MRKKNARPKAGLLADCEPSKTNVADRPGLTRSSAMERLACVSLPAFPLQLLLRSHPDWAGYPAVVIDEDKPQASDLWVNDTALPAGAFPGHSYAAAFPLASGLRAGHVSPAATGHAAAALTRQLSRFPR